MGQGLHNVCALCRFLFSPYKGTELVTFASGQKLVLHPACFMIAMLRKSQEFMLRFWGPQNRIIGQKVGLGIILGKGVFDKVNSDLSTVGVKWHCCPNLALKCQNTYKWRHLFAKECIAQKLRKMISTCFLYPMFALYRGVIYLRDRPLSCINSRSK